MAIYPINFFSSEAKAIHSTTTPLVSQGQVDLEQLSLLKQTIEQQKVDLQQKKNNYHVGLALYQSQKDKIQKAQKKMEGASSPHKKKKYKDFLAFNVPLLKESSNKIEKALNNIFILSVRIQNQLFIYNQAVGSISSLSPS